MNELIKYFNKYYSKEYGKIQYPRTDIQMYRVYQSIKSYGIDDEELNKLLHDTILPKPKSTEEKELYADCLYNTDDSKLVTKEYVDSIINIGQGSSDYATKKYVDDTIDYIEDKSQKLLIDSEFNSAIANSKASSIYNASIIIFNNTLIGNTTYDREADYTDENNKIMGLSAININKILDNVGSNDVLHIVLQYKVNGEEKIYKSSNKIVDATGALSSKLISLSNNLIILDIYANNICNSNFEFEEDSTKCCVRIKYAKNIPIETIDEIKNSLKMYIGLGSLNMLTLNNEEEFIPTLDYHPSTKKYVDDAIQNVLSGTVDQLTDEEFETILSENNYPIMKQVTIKNIEEAYPSYMIINEEDVNTDTYITYTERQKPFSIIIRAGKQSGISLRSILMDGVEIQDNADLCSYNVDDYTTLMITIPLVTEDVEIFVYCEIEPM